MKRAGILGSMKVPAPSNSFLGDQEMEAGVEIHSVADGQSSQLYFENRC